MSVPLGALFLWRLVVFGNYKSAEKAFLVACLLYLAYPISGLLSHPDWGPALEGALRPLMPLDVAGVAMIVGAVGAPIAPRMQFYLQSSIVERKIHLSDCNKSRLDARKREAGGGLAPERSRSQAYTDPFPEPPA